MSYLQVILHLEQALNSCGDPVRFTPTGRKLLNAAGTLMAVEVMRIDMLAQNDCFAVPPPVPAYARNRPGRYAVNIVHIPPELEALIRTSTSLFSCYLLA